MKKSVLRLLSVCVTVALTVGLLCCFSLSASAATIKLGDANGDGEVNMKDVLMLRKFLAGLITELGA